MVTVQDTDPEADFDVILRDTVPVTEIVGRASIQQRTLTLQQWLQPTDYLSPGNEYMKHLHAYVPGTGSWINESPGFKQWARSAATSCLHLKGVAGSGKSVLAASIVDQFQQSEPDTPVLFFFFRQIVDKNCSAKYLIRDFAAQLLPSSQLLLSKIEKLSRTCGVDGTENDALWDILVQGLQDLRKVYCIVDALDEMEEQDFNIVPRLMDVADPVKGNVKIIFTSRPLPKIEDALKNPKVAREKLDASILYPEVAKYVNVSMSVLEPALSPKMEDLVKHTICERAEGLFLHARLMTENLTEGLKDGRITEAMLPDSLESLPRTLKDVYEQLLKDHARRSDVTRDQQENILSCAIHASRPLRLIELGSLIARLREDDDLKEGKRLIRASCGPLLEILEDETVSVIHHSFTEFLRDESRRSFPDSFPVLDQLHGHTMLALASLQYLDGCPLFDIDYDVPDDERLDKYDYKRDDSREKAHRKQLVQEAQLEHPLMSYAISNLPYHIEKAGDGQEKVLEALDTYLTPGKAAFGVWMMMEWKSRLCKSFNIFHLAANTGLHQYVEHLILKHSDLADARDGDGRTPLSYAAQKGYTEIVNSLLRSGADYKSDDRLGLSPLHYAASYCNLGVVRLLLHAGVSPLIQKTKDTPYNVSEFGIHDKGKTALQNAMESGDIDVIHAFTPHIPPGYANKCLHWARGHESVEAILETGHANVDSCCDGKTLLFKAAERHDVETMKVLLRYGADPSKRCAGHRWEDAEVIVMELDAPRGPTPLHALAGYGRNQHILTPNRKKAAEECLKLLLDHGADINATTDGDANYGYSRDDGNLTALHYAVQKRNSTWPNWPIDDKTSAWLVEMLLAAGANPDARTLQEATPLFYANVESCAVIDILVKYGADANATAQSGRTPLLSLLMKSTGLPADVKPDIKVFQGLIDHGAEVNIADRHGRTIFHHFFHTLKNFKAKDIPFLATLIAAGADLNKANRTGVPPLFMYDGGHNIDEAVLGFLVSQGLDLDVRNDKGESILWKIVGRNHANTETLMMFIRLGADVTARANDGTTLLHIAVSRGLSEEWIRCLVSAGVDPSIVDQAGNSLVNTMIANCNASIESKTRVKMLVELGVPPAHSNAKGQSPLHIASVRSLDGERNPRTIENWIDIVMANPVFGLPDVNACDNRGTTPIHLAASVSEYNVDKLLNAGADPTALTREGLSPLHVASRARQPNVVALLLTSYKSMDVLGRLINLQDTRESSQRTALHFACRSGCHEIVSMLLAFGANTRSRDALDRTPLHALAEFPEEDRLWKSAKYRSTNVDMTTLDDTERASQNLDYCDGAYQIIKLLRVAGADLNAVSKSQDGLSIKPMDIAFQTNYSQFLEVFAQQSRSIADSLPSATIDDNETPNTTVQALLNLKDLTDIPVKLAAEIKNGHCDVIKAFAQRGGDLLALDKPGNHTALHMMVRLGQSYLLEYFKNDAMMCDSEVGKRMKARRQKEINDGHVDVHDNSGPDTLLGAACERPGPNLDVIRVLVEGLGVDVNDISHRHGSIYKLKKAMPIHILACGQFFWQVEALEYLLAHGADLQAQNSFNQTPLVVAIDSDWPDGFFKHETVKILLQHGADPNSIDPKSGKSVLAMADDQRLVHLLLEHGADVSSTPGVLNGAVEKLNSEVTQLLLAAGADPNSLSCDPDVDTKYIGDESEKTKYWYPIHKAASQRYKGRAHGSLLDFSARRASISTMLLEHGADPFAPYDNGRYVLQSIIESHGEITPFFDRGILDLERKGTGGRTLLLSACMPTVPPQPRAYRNNQRKPAAPHTKAILALITLGVVIQTTDDRGRTPLHWLCTTPQPFDNLLKEAFGELVSCDPSVIHILDQDGFLPIHLTLRSCQDWATQHLLDQGASPSQPDPDGNTALHLIAPHLVGGKEAAKRAATEFSKFLVLGMDINARNKNGETPISVFIKTSWVASWDPERKIGNPTYAIANDVAHCHVLALFLDAGADPYVLNKDGATLLHITALRQIPDTVSNGDQILDIKNTFKRLLELGLDPRKEDNNMRTAIDIAVARGRTEIISLFSEEAKA